MVDGMVKQTAVRIPAELDSFAQIVCRIEGISMKSLVTRALAMHFKELRETPYSENELDWYLRNK